MDAPPVQYVTTSDGFSIAYTVSGKGSPLVVAPAVIHNVALPARGRRRTLQTWAKRFQVIAYDSRGQGMSQRGLAADHTSEAYERDLEAVADHLKLKRFALHGTSHFGHVAMRFAARHPERVEALVLHNCSVHGIPVLPRHLSELARNDWDAYVHVMVRSGIRGEDHSTMDSYFKECTTQADFLKLTDIAVAANIESFASRVTAPTLVIAAHTPRTDEAGKQLASLIPHSRLLIKDDAYVIDGETTPMALIVESFLEEVSAMIPQPAISANALPISLSTREIEVLRLIAAGRSNQQVADDLVISLNTARRHVSNIFDKIGAANRADAVSYAHRHGLIRAI